MRNVVFNRLINELTLNKGLKLWLEKTVTYNHTVKVCLDTTEKGCDFTNVILKVKNSQVVPVYFPKSQLGSLSNIINFESPVEYNFRINSLLSKVNS